MKGINPFERGYPSVRVNTDRNEFHINLILFVSGNNISVKVTSVR